MFWKWQGNGRLTQRAETLVCNWFKSQSHSITVLFAKIYFLPFDFVCNFRAQKGVEVKTCNLWTSDERHARRKGNWILRNIKTYFACFTFTAEFDLWNGEKDWLTRISLTKLIINSKWLLWFHLKRAMEYAN